MNWLLPAGFAVTLVGGTLVGVYFMLRYMETWGFNATYNTFRQTLNSHRILGECYSNLLVSGRGKFPPGPLSSLRAILLASGEELIQDYHVIFVLRITNPLSV